MRKFLLLAILVLFTSCTAEPIETQQIEIRTPSVSTSIIRPEAEYYQPYEVAQPNVVLCGQVTGCSTNFTYPASVFVGSSWQISPSVTSTIIFLVFLIVIFPFYLDLNLIFINKA